jgi:hypothetical protein
VLHVLWQPEPLGELLHAGLDEGPHDELVHLGLGRRDDLLSRLLKALEDEGRVGIEVLEDAEDEPTDLFPVGLVDALLREDFLKPLASAVERLQHLGEPQLEALVDLHLLRLVIVGHRGHVLAIDAPDGTGHAVADVHGGEKLGELRRGKLHLDEGASPLFAVDPIAGEVVAPRRAEDPKLNGLVVPVEMGPEKEVAPEPV